MQSYLTKGEGWQIIKAAAEKEVVQHIKGGKGTKRNGSGGSSTYKQRNKHPTKADMKAAAATVQAA